MTNTYFLDLEDSNDNALVTVNNWYDLGWYWRKSFSISNSGSALTDYQVRLEIDTQELISTSKMQADGDDIRFTTSNGTSEIPYWIESGINTATTVIWTRIPSIPSGSSTVYIYYSNPDAVVVSTLAGTFPEGSFQDSFTGISLLNSDDSSGITLVSGEAQLRVTDTEIADVRQPIQGSAYSIYEDRWVGQTFSPNTGGALSKVTIRARTNGSPPNPLIVELRNDSGADEPGGTIYAITSRSDITSSYADYDFEFNIAGSLSLGTNYAIVVRTTGGDAGNYYQLRHQNDDVYLGGRRLTSTNGGASWSGTSQDVYFTTYMAVFSALDQSQIFTNANGMIYGGNRQSQSFVAGQSGNLTSVVLNASAVGNPSNGLVVEVRDTEEYILEVLDQSQTLSGSDIQIYSSNRTAQTFRAGSSGSLSKVTLNASKTGVPPADVTVELRDVVTGSLESQDQSQTSYSGERQVYGVNWLAQIFQAGLSDILTKITLRASITGSPSSNMTVELRNVIQTAEENEDQSQTFDDAASNVYGLNWVAQTFRAALSGDLTKLSLRLIRNENANQSQLSYTGERQVYGVNWLAQIFQPNANGDLGQVFLRAGKTGSPSGNLTLELRNTYTVYEETGDQNQPSYSGARLIYTDNRTAQTFYPSYSGNLTKVTLRASRTGSPSGNMTVELQDISGGESADQLQTQNNGARIVYGVRFTGQTFTANMTGTLTKVDLRARLNGSPPDPLVVEIRDATGGDLPGSTLFATTNISASSFTTSYTDYEFVFLSPASVSAGTKYSIVIRTTNGDSSNYFQVRHQNTDVYSGGRRSHSIDGGVSWSGVTQDLYFTTYVNTGAIPGGTILASASRSDVASEEDYDFVFSAPYAISSGTQYALVIHTIGGDASNHYTVSYQASDAYGLGRECSSGNGGASWDGSDSTDLYFRTYVNLDLGLFPGDTVYASTFNGSIAAAGDYAFTFLSPHPVASGTDYAMVIYTTGGDGSNYYSVSYQGTNSYANGRELSSASGGSDWSASAFTDLYFKIILGIPLGPLEIEIRNVDSSNLPGNTVYASISRDASEFSTSTATYDFVFSSPTAVIAGVDYAIVVKAPVGDSGNRYRLRRQSSDLYSNGNRCNSNDGGAVWTAQADDFYFQTFVTADSYIPGGTVYTSVSRGDITSAGEYEFSYSSPYSVTAGTRYAVVIFTGAGDVSNYYGVSYQSTDNYSYGREVSSSNSGSDWTGNDSTDLYFRTYVTVEVGDTPGDTVYASASRGDIAAAGDYDFTFSSPYNVTAETNYALVAYTNGGDASNYYSLFYQASDAYGLGKLCASSDNGTNWMPDGSADLYFKTYIKTNTGQYVPGSTVYASASRDDIVSTIQPYTFFFATPPTISSGSRYTLVFRTTDGDVSNYYNVAYQDVSVYGNGERSVSTDGGANWLPALHDFYFKTYVHYNRSVSASGVLRSVTIPVDTDKRFAAGIQISWNGTEPANTDIMFQLEYYNGSNWGLIPDSALSGNSAGFGSSPVDISSVLTTYDRVRIKVTLSSSNINSIPLIQDWILTYYYRKYSSPEPSAGVGSEE